MASWRHAELDAVGVEGLDGPLDEGIELLVGQEECDADADQTEVGQK